MSTNSRRRPAELRRLLIEAAERVVAERGREASALDIAREARVSRSVLYRHFGDRSELIKEAALRPFQQFLDDFRLAASAQEEQPKSLRDLLEAYLGSLLDHLVAHRAFLLTVLSDDSMMDSETRSVLYAAIDAVIADITALNIAEGAPRDVDVTSLPIKTRLVLAMVAGVSTHGEWLLPRGEGALSRDALVDQMADLILYGVKIVPAAEKERDRTVPGP